MKLLLINVCDPEYKCYRGLFSNYLTYPPLTLAYLAALIPDDIEIEVDFCDEIVEKIDLTKNYDVVAMSFMCVSAKRAYELAKIYKNKGSYLIAGGYHPTFCADEVLEYFDSVIIGAAEISFPQILRDLFNGNPKKIYDNQNVDGIDYKIPKRQIIPKGKYLNVPAVIANRGCINKCEFCAISELNCGSHPRPIDNVIQEIKTLKSKKLVFFDPNFFQDKQYSLELMNELGKLKKQWFCNATIKFTQDEQLLESASKNGCGGVLMGLESFNSNSLKSVNKAFNKPEIYKKSVEILHKYNIFAHACFVLGFDSDTEDDLIKLPDFIEYLGLDLARFSILTPAPNSILYKKLEKENRIITHDWRKYDQNYAVFQPKNMTPQRLEEIYRNVWERTYSIPSILRRVNKSKNNFFNKLFLLGTNLGFKYVGVDACKGDRGC